MNVTVRATTDRAAAYQRLQSVERRAVDGATVPDMADGCLVLDILQDGQAVGAVAVDITDAEATITAGACWGACTYHALTMIEDGLKARGVKRLHMHTRRRGLLDALLPKGYRLQAAHIAKDL